MSIFSIGSRTPILPSNGNYWIADTAAVVGDIEVEEKVSVWFGASIRGDNEKIWLGSGSNIQENCVLHTDKDYPLQIGSNCTIGHGAILHGCVIGFNCIIGMGAIILNGAKIGNNCIVGAGALITEEKNFFESNKLILGSPAKITRDLTAFELRKIYASAIGYQAKMELFKQELSRLENL